MFWHSIFGIAVFLSILFALVPNLLWFVAWCVGLLFGYHIPYAPFGWSAATLAVIVWAFFLCGHYIGRFRSRVTQVEYASARLPKTDIFTSLLMTRSSFI